MDKPFPPIHRPYFQKPQKQPVGKVEDMSRRLSPIRPFAALVLCLALAIPALAGAAAENKFHPPPGVEYLTGVQFGLGGGRPLRMEILRPQAASAKPLPVLVFVHGGGWRSGDRFGHLRQLAPFVQKGYLCASIEYRLSGEAIFPAQIEDCKCAIRFLRAQCKKYNLNPDRIGVWGSSAGGHLVALLGTSGGVAELEGTGGWPEQSSRVQAVCDWFGPADLLNSEGLLGRIPGGPGSPEALLLGGPVAERQELAAMASPVTYVSADDPPFLIMHGDRDRTVPFHQSELLHAALKKAGVDVTFIPIPGAGHGFGPSPEITRAVEEFFAKHLEAM